MTSVAGWDLTLWFTLCNLQTSGGSGDVNWYSRRLVTATPQWFSQPELCEFEFVMACNPVNALNVYNDCPPSGRDSFGETGVPTLGWTRKEGLGVQRFGIVDHVSLVSKETCKEVYQILRPLSRRRILRVVFSRRS
jgi:hypothetical protein